MGKSLKGGEFLNRYRIVGKLKTLAPLHIGTGEESSTRLAQKEEKKSQEARQESKPGKALSIAAQFSKFVGIAEEQAKAATPKDEVRKVSTVIKDYRGKPLIPGSSLRGVMRHWLLDVCRGKGPAWASTRDYEHADLINLAQAEQITKVTTEFSWLELLFGTPFNAGKVEVWDATCLTEDLPVADTLLHWDRRSLTYVDTSVAIDPETGTAVEKLLYQAEVVPPGVTFAVTIAGQNLSDEELGLVLLALQGFNSQIYPIRVGARGGRGYGRLQFSADEIYYLDSAAMPQWVKESIEALSFETKAEATTPVDDAGYLALPRLDKPSQQALMARVKAQLRTGGGD